MHAPFPSRGPESTTLRGPTSRSAHDRYQQTGPTTTRRTPDVLRFGSLCVIGISTATALSTATQSTEPTRCLHRPGRDHWFRMIEDFLDTTHTVIESRSRSAGCRRWDWYLAKAHDAAPRGRSHRNSRRSPLRPLRCQATALDSNIQSRNRCRYTYGIV